MYNVTINYTNGNTVEYSNIETIRVQTDSFNRKYQLYFGYTSSFTGSFHQFLVDPKYMKSVVINGYIWILQGYTDIELQELFFDIASFYRDKEV